jgi:hypothetical protein
VQKFFDQVKISLADDITDVLADKPNCFLAKFKYRNYNVEIDYTSGSYNRGGYYCDFILSIDLEVNLDLVIMPRNFFDRFIDLLGIFPFFNKSKEIRVKSPLLEHELIVLTNNQELARNFLVLSDVSKIVYDYGIAFFKVEEGILNVFLDGLSTEKFEELKSNPSLIKDYLDILVDLTRNIREFLGKE